MMMMMIRVYFIIKVNVQGFLSYNLYALGHRVQNSSKQAVV